MALFAWARASLRYRIARPLLTEHHRGCKSP